ncbi:MAG TPA: hypothetical protein VFW19_05090 [Allosphingosinicella sp.]|nr:hypothetical protein [Allosphingosinicella sp.]
MKWLGCLAVGAMMALPTAAQAGWREAETPHFQIYSDGGETQLVDFAQRLEGLDALLHKATGFPASSDPTKVRVIMLQTMAMVQKASHQRNPNLAGFYTVNIEGPIAVSSYSKDSDYTTTPEITLFHEYAHHFMLEYFPASYPAWYIEGFAEIASTSEPAGGGRMSFGKAASHRGYSLTSSRWIPVQQLLDATYASSPEDSDFYGESWLLAHYLTFAPKRQGQLRKYLGALESGVPNPAAAKAAFGDLDQLNRDARIYLEQANFTYHAVPIALPARDTIKVSELSPGASDLMEESASLSDAMSKEEMAAYLANLKQKAARYPDDPYALQLLADAEYLAGDYAASGAAIDRLLALTPNSVPGRVRKAMVLLQEADTLNGSAREARIAQARRLIVAANQSAVNDPGPLVAYYRSFVVAGERPPRQAIEGLMQAVGTIPADPGPRMMLVNELVRDGRLAEAIAYLEPLAYDPHRGRGRNGALELMQSLKQRLAASANQAPARPAS